MPPPPARRLSRRAAASLPAAARAGFLLESGRDATLLAAAPGLAAHLARASLKVASTSRIPLPRSSTASLCPACGCVYGAADYGAATVIALSARHRARARARAQRRVKGGGGASGSATATPSPVNAAALVIPCVACGRKGMRPFFTADLAAATLARLREGGGGGGGDGGGDRKRRGSGES